MEIEIILSDEQRRRLRSIFSFVGNDNENDILQNILEAAKEEYIVQFLSDGNKNSLSEIRQYKLFLLVKHVFRGMIPSEVEVASIFKIPNTSAKILIKNMRSRYQFEIEQYFKETIRVILNQINVNENVNNNGGYFQLYIRSPYMLSEMNQIIELGNQNYEKIKRLDPYSSFYKISPDSRQLLVNYIK